MNILASSVRLPFGLAIVSAFQVSYLKLYCDYAGGYLSLQLFQSFAVLYGWKSAFNQSVSISLSYLVF